MSLLTTPIVENSHIEAIIWFSFLENVRKQTLKYQILTPVKRSEKNYQVRQILALLCNLTGLILG